ncbi:MAG TPA: ATP-dependent DNA helicase RecQ [Polyangiaceae bacterium]|nr:ATP-dependent DNA helicase RecQ [Polyangiaceae bacterium]
MLSCLAPVPSASFASPLDLTRVLAERFQLPAFHPWQREAIDSILAETGQVLLIAPTGGGKSLCYQLPAVVLPGTTVVISPLIALMQDQVRGLTARGIEATFLASTLDADERRRRLAGLRRGEFKIVYVAPERLAFEGFSDLLGTIELSLLAVDEAHCIAQWGHDFRPDYLRIGALIDRLRPRRILACTATATPDTQREIRARLRLEGPATKVILRGFARPNLALSVCEVGGPRDALQGAHLALTRALAGEGDAALRKTKGKSQRAAAGAAIVYAATRRGSENLARGLADLGWKARAYHAGLGAEVRTDVQKAFAERTLSVVVATNAFGMGIDRPDVRAVIHAQPPGSIEGYYQEVGRAGRDGAAAVGLLMLAPGDVTLRRRLCELGSDGGPAPAEQVDRAWSLFRALLRYVDAATCRHDFILRYFGDEAESLGGCGRCDVCRDLDRAREEDPAALAEESTVLRQALAGVARARGRGGIQAIAEMLRGKATDRVVRFGFDGLSTYGLMPARSQEEVMRLLRAALAAGWIDLSGGEFPIPVLTVTGAKVMRAEEPVRIRLPHPPRGNADAGIGVVRRRSGKGRRPIVGDAEQRASAISGLDATLFEALRVHRATIASESGVAPFIVAHDRTLAAIAARRPANPEELEQVPGMGPAKIARYGEGFLAIVRRATPS